MARRSTIRPGVIRAFGYALIPCAIVVSVIGVGAAIAVVTVLPSFSAARSLGTDLAPVSIAIADMNGDGTPDLATANRLGSNVSVFLNFGDGSFQARRDYGISAEPTSLAVGDVNGDRKPDLVTSNHEGTVSVLPNAGEGSFGVKRDYPTGLSPYSVAIGDLNGDGTPDLAVAVRDDDVSGSGAVSVLMNTGSGAFGAGQVYPIEADPAAVAIGDLNGDGSADLTTANTYAGTLSVLLNDGGGHFRPRRDYPTGDWAPSVAIGDLNADGAPDLATANYHSDTVSVLANWGDGSFVPRRDFRTGEGPWSIAIGDLNGDGKPDLATASESSDTVSMLANTTGLCTVPKVRAKTVPAAKRAITYGLCGLGRIRRTYSGVIAKGRVLSASPKPGSVLPTGGRVSLVVSRGRRR
jgi:predicted NUDIX family NTP pyrophosphohydrolase